MTRREKMVLVHRKIAFLIETEEKSPAQATVIAYKHYGIPLTRLKKGRRRVAKSKVRRKRA
jgi:hypothetical protein